MSEVHEDTIIDEIEANGWMLWPPIRYSYRTHNLDLPVPAPAPVMGSTTPRPASPKLTGPARNTTCPGPNPDRGTVALLDPPVASLFWGGR